MTDAATESTVRFREARPADALVVAALHLENLPAAFLPTLGLRFLERLYTAMIGDEDGLVVVAVAEDDGSVVGFVGAVRSVPRFYRRFALKHGIAALLAAGWRLTRPGTLRAAAETVLYARDVEAPVAEILSAAVRPEYRGTGVGLELIEDVVARLGTTGVPAVRTTINTRHRVAASAFERQGFRRVGRVAVHRGKPNDVLVRDMRLAKRDGPRRLGGPEGNGELIMPRPIRVAHVATVGPTVRLLLIEQLRRLRDEGFDVAAISAPDPRGPELEAEGIRYLPWPGATRAFDLASDARAFASLYRILRRERFDVVHTHNPKPGFLGRFAARLAGVPCVVNTVHGLYATPDDGAPRKALVLSLEWLAGRVSHLELFQSEEDLRWARRIGLVDPPPGAYLGNGVDVRRFDPQAVPGERVAELRDELGIPRDAPVVG
ncbi:MAG TPA: GNAT family N-acetyltransferase, partial [Actinomycetota bacterium]|nr:GNAT family N-acetyltransferase [Actinomycetota bacterium]